MIKVLHLITDLNVGGAEMSLFRLLSGMERAQFENRAVCMTAPGLVSERIAALGIDVEHLGMAPGVPSPGGVMNLVKILRREKPDVLQTWLYHADLLGLLAGKLAGVKKLVWNIRNSDLDFSKYRRTTMYVVKACARLSGFPAAVVVNSQAGQESHARLGYRPKRWERIFNGIDASVFTPDAAARNAVRQELGIAPGALLVGNFARFDPLKDQANFIAAAAELTRLGVDAHFVLAGLNMTRDNPALNAQVTEAGLTGQVHLLGRRADLPRLYAALDIFGLSSGPGEGFPNVVAEAMACGVPCVVTDSGDSAFVVGDTGIVVPVRNPVALAEAWKTLGEAGEATRTALGTRARQRIAGQFSLENTVGAYQRLYSSLAV